jgi:plastocyanin
MVMFPLRRLCGLLLLMGLVASCGGYSSNASPSAPSPTPSPSPTPAPASTPSGSATAITIPAGASTLGTSAFVPNPTTVTQAAGAVTWTNTDSTVHDIVSDTGVWDSGRIAPNGNFGFTLTAKGTYTYHCSIHPGMRGTIVVQ